MNPNHQKKIYLVNPRSDYLNAHNNSVFEDFGQGRQGPIALTADLTLPTLAAMIPETFQVELGDEFTSPINFATDAKIIFIVIKSTNLKKILKIAQTFREKNKIIIMGGPEDSIEPEVLTPACDILVVGEINSFAEELFRDLHSGRWKRVYQDSIIVKARPHSKFYPPRWDLYLNDKALTGTLQIGRGVPFQRDIGEVLSCDSHDHQDCHREISQIIQELESLYSRGYQKIYITDNHLTCHHAYGMDLLHAIAQWNNCDGQFRAYLMALMPLETDEEFIQACAEAGIGEVFLGMEYRLEERLTSENFVSLNQWVAKGIMVKAGITLGFDSDLPSLFENQLTFLQNLPIPLYYLTPLQALKGTPLYQKMGNENRLIEPSFPLELRWATNVKLKNMSEGELRDGLDFLAKELFSASNFECRVQLFTDLFERKINYAWDLKTKVDQQISILIFKFIAQNPEETAMIVRVLNESKKNPSCRQQIFSLLFSYVNLKSWLKKLPKLKSANFLCSLF